MIITYLILIPLLALSLWLFFKSSPRKSNAKIVLIYNLTTVAIAVLISIIYSLYLRASMINGSDFGWWPVLSFIFSLVIIIITVLILGLLRNFVIFRNK